MDGWKLKVGDQEREDGLPRCGDAEGHSGGCLHPDAPPDDLNKGKQEKKEGGDGTGKRHSGEFLDPGSVPEDVKEDDLPASVVKELDLQNQRWKERIAGISAVEVVNLTLCTSIKSRHTPEVQRAISTTYVRLQGLQLPVYRCHSDRAREFTGKMLRDWFLAHDIEHTTTAADESAGNGRAESETARIKPHQASSQCLKGSTDLLATGSMPCQRGALQKGSSVYPIYREMLNSASRHRPSKSMELRRAASGLVKVICRTADSRPGGKGQKPGKPKKKDGLLASFSDWFGSINMMNILYIWFPASWGPSVVEAIQKRNETWLAKNPIVRDPYIFNRAEAAMGSLSREVTCKIQKWNIKADGFHPILVANARVDWLALKDDDITKKFPILLEGILQDVFSQRASSAWQGAQPQKLTVSMLLPGTSAASEWRDLLQSRRQFWPTLLSCPCVYRSPST